MIISFILMTLMLDSEVILKREIWREWLLGVKGLRFLFLLLRAMNDGEHYIGVVDFRFHFWSVTERLRITLGSFFHKVILQFMIKE